MSSARKMKRREEKMKGLSPNTAGRYFAPAGHPASIEFWRQIGDAVTPHLPAVRRAWDAGSSPVVIIDPLQPNTAQLAGMFDGRTNEPVIGVDRRHIQRIFAYPAEQTWLEAEPRDGGPVHFWLLIEDANFCMVWDSNGIHPAAGTTDIDMQN